MASTAKSPPTLTWGASPAGVERTAVNRARDATNKARTVRMVGPARNHRCRCRYKGLYPRRGARFRLIILIFFGHSAAAVIAGGRRTRDLNIAAIAAAIASAIHIGYRPPEGAIRANVSAEG